jgi:pimeloyl-ACP methyl ester carboxylesterase
VRRAIGAFAAFLSSGCSLVMMQQRSLEQGFERVGLTQHVEQLGPATVRWWSGGEGPPLVLIHGFGGDATWGWAAQTPLARGRKLIVPDLVWFGGSHAEPTGEATLALQVATLQRLLAREGVQQADLVGISYGGYVATAFVSANPERVRRLVIVDSPGIAYSDADFEAFLASVGATNAEEVFVPTEPSGVQRLIDLATFKEQKLPAFLLRDSFKHMFSQWSSQRRDLLADLRQSRDHLRETWSIPVPTLVIWGAEDRVFPLAQGEALAAAIPGARLVVIPRTAHAPPAEAPSAFNDAVDAFLKEGP